MSAHTVQRDLAVAALMLGLSLNACADEPIRFETATYRVSVVLNCEEYVIGCQDVAYVGTHKKTGKTIRLKGKEEHAACRDGVTPCRFLGYRFANGAYTYRVSDDNRLTVTQGKKVILDEPATAATP